jgi:hypothetical protein
MASNGTTSTTDRFQLEDDLSLEKAILKSLLDTPATSEDQQIIEEQKAKVAKLQKRLGEALRGQSSGNQLSYSCDSSAYGRSFSKFKTNSWGSQHKTSSPYPPTRLPCPALATRERARRRPSGSVHLAVPISAPPLEDDPKLNRESPHQLPREMTTSLTITSVAQKSSTLLGGLFVFEATRDNGIQC